MKRVSAVALGLTLALAACNEPVAPPAETDAGNLDVLKPDLAIARRAFRRGERQPRVDLERGTLALFPEGQGQNLTQTFTPQRRQRLGFLRLPVGCASGVLLKVRIRDGVGGPILFDSNHSGLPVIVDGSFQLLQVFDPATSRGIRLRRNHVYAFELSAFPSSGATESTCGLARGPVGDSYRRGQGFFEDVPTNGEGWLPIPNGAPGDQEDLPFITLVR